MIIIKIDLSKARIDLRQIATDARTLINNGRNFLVLRKDELLPNKKKEAYAQEYEAMFIFYKDGHPYYVVNSEEEVSPTSEATNRNKLLVNNPPEIPAKMKELLATYATVTVEGVEGALKWLADNQPSTNPFAQDVITPNSSPETNEGYKEVKDEEKKISSFNVESAKLLAKKSFFNCCSNKKVRSDDTLLTEEDKNFHEANNKTSLSNCWPPSKCCAIM